MPSNYTRNASRRVRPSKNTAWNTAAVSRCEPLSGWKTRLLFLKAAAGVCVTSRPSELVGKEFVPKLYPTRAVSAVLAILADNKMSNLWGFSGATEFKSHPLRHLSGINAFPSDRERYLT